MMKKTNDRSKRLDSVRAALVLLLGLGALGGLAAASSGCRDPKKEEPAVDVAEAAASDAAPLATPDTPADASSPVATSPSATDVDDSTDGGADAGRRRRRRLLAPGVDAGAADPQPPEPVATAEPSSTTGVKRRPAQMGNDEVYGAPSTSAAPVLKKKPLPAEDPWARDAGSAR